ncbi:MAG: hypothetical protein IT380_10135 [Myxococcales bacterium]|nr:hypothetical protein [Myxococcales bacterium]
MRTRAIQPERWRLWADVIKPFLGDLEDSEQFGTIETGRNSFEGWLKWELAAACVRRFFPDGFAGDRIGLESREALSKVVGQDKKSKLVDFWMSALKEAPATKSVDRYHLVELKVVFANGNAMKQASSAANDFWYLSTLAEGVRPDEIGVLAFVQSKTTADLVVRRIDEVCGRLVPRARRPVRYGTWTALFFDAHWADSVQRHGRRR